MNPTPEGIADKGNPSVNIMRVLVACEFTGTVREAFRALGHDAWSCDLLPTERPGPHLQCDVRNVLDQGWDLVIAHPPCTYLTVSGNRWMHDPRFPTRAADRAEAMAFFRLFIGCAPRVAIENPVGVMSTHYRKPDQVIQPWMFGHSEQKATCPWLENLPCLVPTAIVPLPVNKRLAQRLHYLPPSPERWKLRSATYPGIAAAMAEQWSSASTILRREQGLLWSSTIQTTCKR